LICLLQAEERENPIKIFFRLYIEKLDRFFFSLFKNVKDQDWKEVSTKLASISLITESNSMSFSIMVKHPN
jgi:hypothetical protein